MDKNLYAVGTRIYYTGDMANASGAGVITKHYDATRWDDGSFDVLLDDGRDCFRRLMPRNFTKGPGRRFWLESEYQAHQAAQIEQMKAEYEAMTARRQSQEGGR